MRQVTNSIIVASQRYLVGKTVTETLLDEGAASMVPKIQTLLRVAGEFKRVYFHYKANAAVECPANPWRISNIALFSRLDAFLERCHDVLEVANVLCPGNIVVSGSDAACRRLEEAATAAGAMKCVRLEVAGAFHTVLMQQAVDRLAAALAETTIRSPRIPVISNVDARPHADPAEIRGLLARQVCGVVEWNASMTYLLSTGVRTLCEVGPGRVLRGLLKRIDRSVVCSGVPE
jgi:malonyl CoA-acyl carrier protein transacylase